MVVIEQAKGVLAERNAMSMEVAFDSLRTYARDQNLKLTDLAIAIVHHDFNPALRTGPPPPDQCREAAVGPRLTDSALSLPRFPFTMPR